MEFYVYYRARCEHAPELQAAVRDMQAALSNRYKVHTALKRRPQAQDGRYTWMEVYADASPGFEAALAEAVEQTGIASLIDGERHIEAFVEASSCA